LRYRSRCGGRSYDGGVLANVRDPARVENKNAVVAVQVIASDIVDQAILSSHARESLALLRADHSEGSGIDIEVRVVATPEGTRAPTDAVFPSVNSDDIRVPSPVYGMRINLRVYVAILPRRRRAVRRMVCPIEVAIDVPRRPVDTARKRARPFGESDVRNRRSTHPSDEGTHVRMRKRATRLEHDPPVQGVEMVAMQPLHRASLSGDACAVLVPHWTNELESSKIDTVILWQRAREHVRTPAEAVVTTNRCDLCPSESSSGS
jgi:hypothetical protein